LWEQKPELADAGFLLSREPIFPTWWTPLPFRVGVLTGWSAGPKADPLLNIGREAVINTALQQFARIAGLQIQTVQGSLKGAHYHDWHADPYAGGAYSYTPAGALSARLQMTEPVASTLFFAGEATEINGHSATVHGAMAAGLRAATQVLAAIR
jgi:monoamine oxidase